MTPALAALLKECEEDVRVEEPGSNLERLVAIVRAMDEDMFNVVGALGVRDPSCLALAEHNVATARIDALARGEEG